MQALMTYDVFDASHGFSLVISYMPLVYKFRLKLCEVFHPLALIFFVSWSHCQYTRQKIAHPYLNPAEFHFAMTLFPRPHHPPIKLVINSYMRISLGGVPLKKYAKLGVGLEEMEGKSVCQLPVNHSSFIFFLCYNWLSQYLLLYTPIHSEMHFCHLTLKNGLVLPVLPLKIESH